MGVVSVSILYFDITSSVNYSPCGSSFVQSSMIAKVWGICVPKVSFLKNVSEIAGERVGGGGGEGGWPLCYIRPCLGRINEFQSRLQLNSP